MLSKEDLIYFGAMFLRSKDEPPTNETCVKIAEEIFNIVFKEEKE